MTVATDSPTHPARVVPFGEVVATFARIGLLSFGGPAGQIALMHRVLVDEKRWLSEARFLHALNYCMLLPGPEAMQLATYCGWLLQGVRGGLVAGLLFVIPGAVAVIALSALYFFAHDLPLVAGLFYGIKAAVLAIVVEALVRVARRALKSTALIAVAVAAFVAIAFLAIPFPAVVIVAALIGLALPRGKQTVSDDDILGEGTLPEWAQSGWRRFATTLGVWLAIWLAPLAALHLVMPGNTLAQAANFFSVMAMVTFGGAYAVLAYVGQQAVEVYGWLQPAEMLTGLGLAETTPGPLILVLVFIGFLGGARLSGFDPFTGGLAGAAVALWFTFVPCFLWIFVGAPYIERLRKVRWLADALSAVTAAVVGIIGSLALWFGLHVLFTAAEPVTFGPFRVLVPELASFDAFATAIAGVSAIALLGFKVPMLVVLGAAALLGIAASML